MDFKEENESKLQFGSCINTSSPVCPTQKLENTVKSTHSENKIRCSGTECGNDDVDFVQFHDLLAPLDHMALNSGVEIIQGDLRTWMGKILQL